jgi:plastocyanin
MKKILLIMLSVIMLGAGGIYFDGNNTWLASPQVAAQGQAQSVTIQNFAFTPASITVTPGTTVTWTNKDNTAHTVTADSGNGPNSGQLQQGQTYSFTFQQAGTYAYHCTIHPEMKATVVVSSSSSGSTGTSPSTSGGAGAGNPQQQQHQQQTQTMPSMGGMGAGTPQAPQPATPPQETGGQGQVATGPVETGNGSLAANSQGHEVIALVLGSLSLVAASALLLVRRQQMLSR